MCVLIRIIKAVRTIFTFKKLKPVIYFVLILFKILVNLFMII